MKKYLPRCRTNDLIEQNTPDEILIYDLATNRAFCLNPSLTSVWQLCNGTKTVPEIAAAISKKSGAAVSEEFVWLALDQLKKENLLTDKDFDLRQITGLSRREVVKKLGFASVIALPVIISLVAPTAASAQSCVAENGVCGPTMTCCPGLDCVFVAPLGGSRCI